jgi:hypothetical protein
MAKDDYGAKEFHLFQHQNHSYENDVERYYKTFYLFQADNIL